MFEIFASLTVLRANTDCRWLWSGTSHGCPLTHAQKWRSTHPRNPENIRQLLSQFVVFAKLPPKEVSLLEGPIATHGFTSEDWGTKCREKKGKARGEEKERKKGEEERKKNRRKKEKERKRGHGKDGQEQEFKTTGSIIGSICCLGLLFEQIGIAVGITDFASCMYATLYTVKQR